MLFISNLSDWELRLQVLILNMIGLYVGAAVMNVSLGLCVPRGFAEGLQDGQAFVEVREYYAQIYQRGEPSGEGQCFLQM